MAASLKGADAATISDALHPYLDPDGDGSVALVQWDTVQEQGTVGFYAERAAGDAWERLNGGLLPGLIDAPQGGEYWLLDPEVTAGTYRYQLVELEAWGTERLHGPWDVQIDAAAAVTQSADISARAQLAAQPLAQPTKGDSTVAWGEWQGLAQGFAARRRVPPPPPIQRPSSGAATQDPSTPAIQLLATGAVTQEAAALVPTRALWLRTNAEGLYRMPVSQLATLLGRGVNQMRSWLSSGNNMPLTNAGAPTPWFYDKASDAMYFVGQDYRTLHTDANAYWVDNRVKAPSLTMGQQTGSGPTPGVPSGAFLDTLRIERDLTYSLWSVTDDTEADFWFWDYLYAGTGHDSLSVPLTLPDAAAGGQGQLRGYLRGWTDFERGNDHRVSATLNGADIGAPLEWDGFTTAVFTAPFAQELLGTDDALGLLSEKIDASAAANPGQWLDRIEVDYWREPIAANGQLWLRGLDPGVHTVTGFSSSAIHVVEAPASPQAVWRGDLTIVPSGDGWQVSFDAPQGGDFLVVEDAAVQTPTADIDVLSTLKKRVNEADYLIVAPRALEGTAQALAAYRAETFPYVKIVWLEDIYDEFSAGRTDPRALSDFLATVRLKATGWKRVPEYVVLLGNGTLDQKDRLGYGDSLLPVRMAMTPWGLGVSDNRYTDTDNDGLSDFAFGRIPVTTDAQGLAYVQKLQAAQPPLPRAVIVADNPDSGGDFAANADRQAAQLVGLGLDPVTKLYHPTDPVRTALTNPATWEVAYVSYDGHGSALQLGNSRENFLKQSDAAALSNQVLPVFVALTCEAGNGAVPGWGGSVAGALVLNPIGGAVAALAPTSVSLDNDAQVIGASFADDLIGSGLSIGQAARDAQEQSAGVVAPFMLGTYQVLGDPAAQLP